MAVGRVKPVAAVAVVALRDRSVLLVKRGQAPRRDCWSFPGGSVEPGETARDAARREAWEETGLVLQVEDVIDVYDAVFPAGGSVRSFHYCVAEYLALPVEPQAEPVAADDAVDARWVDFEQLRAYEITDAMRCVLRRALWLRGQRRPAPLGLTAEGDCLGPQVGSAAGAAPRGVYVITARLGAGRGHLEVADAALRGGAGAIQLRDKQLPGAPLLELARRIRCLTRGTGAQFIVNDRVDVAQAAEADGVHLGQDDLPAGAARRLLGAEACIGVSVETVAQAQRAQQEGASYVGVGDIFGTRSKPDAGEPVGLDHLRAIRAAIRIPIVAVGGITAAHLARVRQAGADSAAVISAVAAAPDMAAATRELAAAWEAAAPREP